MTTRRNHSDAPQDEPPPWLLGPSLAVFGGLAILAVSVVVYVALGPAERDVAGSLPMPTAEPSEEAKPPASASPSPPARATVARPVKPSRPAPDSGAPGKAHDDVASSAVPRPRRPADHPNPPEAIPARTDPPAAPDESFEEVLARSLLENPFDDVMTEEATGGPQPVVVEDEPSPPVAAEPTGGGITVPDKATIAAKTKEIRLLFKAEYANRDPAARGTLARLLAEKATESTHDPAAAYVLAVEARDQAVQAGDIEVYSIVGRFLTDEFGIDTHDDDIVAFGRLQTQTSRSAEWYHEVFNEVVNRVHDMEARDDFDRAVRYSNVAKALALKIADQDAVKEWTQRIKDLSTLKTQFASYRSAQSALRDDADDAAANTKWGTYLCLLKGDFEAGVPHLLKGSDPALAGLAKQETNQSRTVADTVALADAWWDYGEKNKAFRNQARRHAEELYQTVRTQLVGLEATRIDKRLEDQAKESGVPLIEGKTVAEFLSAVPWYVRWERIQGADRVPGGVGAEFHFDETMTFTEDGQVESRYFQAYVVRRDSIELIGRERDGPPEDGGEPGFQRNLPRRGRAIITGNELRVLAARGERPDRPDRRGVGTRQAPQ
jgi:hypothetical protein